MTTPGEESSVQGGPGSPRSRPGPGLRRSLVVPLALAAAVYVLAGFWVDLPPYGIWLDGSATRVVLDGESASVTSTLTYRSTSWRPRGTTVYLPFSQAFGAGPAQEVKGPEGFFQSHEDGVLLDLRLLPDSTFQAEFTFRQDTPGDGFQVDFPVARGWGRPPAVARWEVWSYGGRALQFSLPKLSHDSAGGTDWWRLEGRGDEPLVIRWR